MANDIIAGRLEITLNGKRVMVAGKFTVKLDVDKNEPLVGPDGLHGMKAMPRAGQIIGVARDHKKLGLKTTIGAMKNATIVALPANGKKYLCESCTYSGDLDLDLEEATFPFEATAETITEIKG